MSDEKDILENFFGNSKKLLFGKGSFVIRDDEQTPQGIYFLKSGYVKMNKLLEDGRELTINYLRPGSFFPMIWGITDIANSDSFQAMTEVVVFREERSKVIEFLTEKPNILLHLTRRMLIGFDGLLHTIEYLLVSDSYSRVATVLSMLATRFGSKKINSQIQIILPVTHQDIANLAAISRETASIMMDKLKKQKLISYRRGQIIIIDPTRLQSITK